MKTSVLSFSIIYVATTSNPTNDGIENCEHGQLLNK